MQFNCLILAHFMATVTTDALFLVDGRDFINYNCITGACFFADTAGRAF